MYLTRISYSASWEYAEAGSEYITTNTFGASPLKLADYGLEDQVEAIAQAAVRNARAASPHIRVAGDIGPTGQFIRPLGDLSFDEAASNFYRLAKALADAGADCLIIETIIDIQEMRAALTAAKAACSLPVICQMSYSEDGRTITGTDPAAAAILLDAMGADVIGANCSVGPDKLLEAAKQMARVTDKPLIIQPNAGMPVLDGNTTRFPLAPEDMAPISPVLRKPASPLPAAAAAPRRLISVPCGRPWTGCLLRNPVRPSNRSPPSPPGRAPSLSAPAMRRS